MLKPALAVWLRAQLRRHDSLSVAAALELPAPPFARAALAPSYGLLDTRDFHVLLEHVTPAPLGELPSAPHMPAEQLEMWVRLLAARVIHEPWGPGPGVQVNIQEQKPQVRLQRAVVWGAQLGRPVTYAAANEAAAQQVRRLLGKQQPAVQVWTLKEAVLTLAAWEPDRLRALSELHSGVLVVEGLDYLNPRARLPILSLIQQHRVQGLSVMRMDRSSHELLGAEGIHGEDRSGSRTHESLDIEASQNGWNYRQTAQAFARLLQ